MSKEVVFIIDKSGSMKGSETRVVSGYNELLEEQKAEPGTVLLTTILFDTESTTLHNGIEIQEATELGRSDYVPNGMTALLDAVGDAANGIKERNGSGGGLLVIMTDGMENSSKRFTHADINQQLNELKSKGWQVLYIGADLADFADAERLGIRREERMPISKERLQPAMKIISSGMKEFRKGKPMDLSEVSTEKRFERSLPYKGATQGYALIDTGSPISFGDIDEVRFGSVDHPISRNPLLGEIRRHLGQDVSAVIGMDILRHYDVRIDHIPPANDYHVRHDRKPQLKSDEGTPLRYVMGIPVVDVTVNGDSVPMFVDTGSQHTFIDQSLARGPELGSAHDFYPGLGEFTSPTYRTRLSLCERDFSVNAAVLPKALEYLLSYSGVKGILGLDVLKQQWTWLGFLSGVLAFDAAGDHLDQTKDKSTMEKIGDFELNLEKDMTREQIDEYCKEVYQRIMQAFNQKKADK